MSWVQCGEGFYVGLRRIRNKSDDKSNQKRILRHHFSENDARMRIIRLALESGTLCVGSCAKETICQLSRLHYLFMI